MQIGPRIRVGGTLGKIGEAIKKPIGTVAKVAAVPLGFVNPALGMGVGALGGALSGGGVKGALGGAALGASGAGIRAVGQLGALGSGGGVVDSLKGLGGAVASGGLRAVGGAAKGLVTGGQGGNGFGLDDLLGLGLGGLAGYEGIKSQQQSDALMKEAMAGAKADYAAKAPLREAGLQQLMSVQAPDLSDLQVPGNPYARIRAVKKVA